MTKKIIIPILAIIIVVAGGIWFVTRSSASPLGNTTNSTGSLGTITTPTPSPTPFPPSPSTPSGSTNNPVAISEAMNGTTIQLKTHENFSVHLGAAQKWTITFDPASSIKTVQTVNMLTGYSGNFEALTAGTVVMHAEGRPVCKSEMCAQYIIEDTVTLVITN